MASNRFNTEETLKKFESVRFHLEELVELSYRMNSHISIHLPLKEKISSENFVEDISEDMDKGIDIIENDIRPLLDCSTLKDVDEAQLDTEELTTFIELERIHTGLESETIKFREQFHRMRSKLDEEPVRRVVKDFFTWTEKNSTEAKLEDLQQDMDDLRAG